MNYAAELEPFGHWEGRVFRFNETQVLDDQEIDAVDCTQAAGPDGEPMEQEDLEYAVASILGIGPEKLVHDRMPDSPEGYQTYAARPVRPEDN